ncbi:uncharacterized protein LOC142583061 isoform X2 [Dermacentor variabilis]|uniref:uncharacterized protein LOC142583061 isoform X2 n=1 Tax=Dermacentor variabilis TaxID=34621 RepID=UPI003F5C34B4
MEPMELSTTRQIGDEAREGTSNPTVTQLACLPSQLSQDLRGLTVSTVGKRLENLSMEDLEDFTPRAETVPVQAKTNEWSEVSSNGTSTTSSTIAATKDLLGAEAFSPMKEEDPMCMVRALMKSQLNDVEANTLRRLVDEVMDALGPERVGEEWEPSDWFDD